MINPTNITYIVRKTLNRMGVHEPAMETLIKGTFLAESGFENLFDHKDNRHGLMLMRKPDIDYTLNEYVKYKRHLKLMVTEVCGYDLDHTDLDVIINEIDSNLALQVLVLYSWYDSKGLDIVEDDIEKLAIFYRNEYSHNREGDIDAFVNSYKEVFVN